MATSHSSRRVPRGFLALVIAFLVCLLLQLQYGPSNLDEKQPEVQSTTQNLRGNLLRRFAIVTQHDHQYSDRTSTTKSLEVPYASDSLTLDVTLSQTNGTTSYIEKRAEPIDFEFYRCKGEQALSRIRNAKAEDPKFSYDDLASNGWVMDENEPFKLPQAVLDAMKGINAPTTEDKNPRVRARLLNSFRNYLGQETESNGGEFTNAYNVAGSAIIAIDNTSPAYCANMDWETFRPSTNPKTGDALKALLPPMNSWSDIVWAIWAKNAGSDADGLRYLIRVNVVNPITKALIEKANGIEGDTVLNLPWPGKKFSADEAEGQALLGSPHGAGTTWLSVIGRKTLGARATPSCTVFTGLNDVGTQTYFMLWDLGEKCGVCPEQPPAGENQPAPLGPKPRRGCCGIM